MPGDRVSHLLACLRSDVAGRPGLHREQRTAPAACSHPAARSATWPAGPLRKSATAARPAEPSRSAAGADEEQVVAGHRCRLDLADCAVQLPELLTGRGVVRPHLRTADANDLRARLVLPHERTAPAGPFRSWSSPQLLAGLRVEGDEERFLLIVGLDE